MEKEVKEVKEIKRLSFSFPESIKEELEKEATQRARKLPSLVKMILNNYLRNLDKKEKK